MAELDARSTDDRIVDDGEKSLWIGGKQLEEKGPIVVGQLIEVNILLKKVGFLAKLYQAALDLVSRVSTAVGSNPVSPNCLRSPDVKAVDSFRALSRRSAVPCGLNGISC